LKRKPRTRLKDFDYRGRYRYFVTICTENKKQLFIDGRHAETILSILREESEKHAFMVWGYCFMPDHLHLLVEGDAPTSDLKQFLKAFKQRTSYVCRREAVGSVKKLWQPSYYEHILRRDEDTVGVLRYILNNPVRKDLAEHFLDYAYSGSFQIDLKEISF
jgi:putative transposase